jgi:probable rRNA maturation factor
MFHFSLINEPHDFRIDIQKLTDIFAYIGAHVDIPQQGTLNFAFLSDAEIQALNHEYRGIDATTDVLSFHYFEDFSEVNDDEVVGECIFSEAKILTQATEHGHSPRQEFEILAIHSILHILLFDHESDEDYRVMWAVEKPIRDYFSL